MNDFDPPRESHKQIISRTLVVKELNNHDKQVLKKWKISHANIKKDLLQYLMEDFDPSRFVHGEITSWVFLLRKLDHTSKDYLKKWKITRYKA